MTPDEKTMLLQESKTLVETMIAAGLARRPVRFFTDEQADRLKESYCRFERLKKQIENGPLRRPALTR